MRRFVEGTDRGQSTLFPECLEDWIGEGNAVRVVDVFVEELDLAGLGFGGTVDHNSLLISKILAWSASARNGLLIKQLTRAFLA